MGGHGCSSPCSLTSKSSTRDLITFDLHAEKPDVKIAPRVGPTFVMTRRAPPAGMITTQVGPKFVKTTGQTGANLGDHTQRSGNQLHGLGSHSDLEGEGAEIQNTRCLC